MKKSKLEYYKIKFVLRVFFGIKIDFGTYTLAKHIQCQKGLKKYGITLKECNYNSYDWQRMALEEIIDLQQYSKKFKKIL